MVLPASHPLTARASLGAADLTGETLLVGERCGGFAVRLIETSECSFVVRRCGGSWVQMLDLVAAELGIALLPDSLGLRPGVVSRPLTTPALRRTVMLTQVAGRPHGAAVTNFMKLCRARAFA